MPDFRLEYFKDEARFKNVTKIYSDLYFKQNKSLFGYIKHIGNLAYGSNNTSVFNDELFNSRKINFEYMPIYMFVNYDHAHLKLLMDLTTTESKKSLSASNSFKKPIPLIVYNTEIEDLDEVKEKSFGEKCNRVCSNYYFYRTKKKKQKINLDEISPVENEHFCISTPKIKKQHKSLEEIEKMLFEKKKLELQLQAERNLFLLEPLLLENLPTKRIDHKLTPIEHKKIVRFTIMYTLAFFALAIVTFFIIYLA